LQRIPFLKSVELALILAPLAFHACFGVVLLLESRFNVSAYPKNRNWMFVAQRVSGVIAFAFIVWHLTENWLPFQRGDVAAADFHARLTARLSSTWRGIPTVALAYLLGIGATTFHLANGLWGFVFSWGLAVRARTRNIAAVGFGLAGLVLFILAANTAIYFATGSSVLPASRNHDQGRGPQATP
jgi:succinate dehydrogenase / fumarate reductase cytochrome b subunit